MITKTNDMSTIKIPHNGLPQGLNNIPFGQVFILTNPSVGITAKTIKFIEFIHSLASKKKLNQKSNTVNSLPVDYPGLMDSFICKVKTEDGVQLLVSDKDSLLEMLCEFWGLDYEEVSKIPNIIPGWHINNNGVTIGGESHPVRIPVRPTIKGSVETEKDSVSLQLLQVHSRENTIGDIRSTFKDNFNFGLGISLDEIIALYKEEEKNRKSYRLDIQVKWKKYKEFVPGRGMVQKKKMTACDLSLIDNMGHPYSFELEAMAKAIYLTYLFFPDGIAYTQISSSDEFYNIFKQIYSKLPRAKACPRQFDLENKEDLDTFTNYISRIRKAILKETNDNYAEEQFGVEGKKKDNYGIAGATDENRDVVRREFEIK